MIMLLSWFRMIWFWLLVLDSGCSYHISQQRSWFIIYEEKSGGNFLMGNNAPCKLVGIGSIQIIKHDGIFRTLTETHHVPQLKKNLVFVGAMYSKGFSWWVEGGVMQIKGKWKSMVMHGTKQGNPCIDKRVHCDKLCLNCFTSWEPCIQWFVQ